MMNDRVASIPPACQVHGHFSKVITTAHPLQVGNVAWGTVEDRFHLDELVHREDTTDTYTFAKYGGYWIAGYCTYLK